MLQLHYVWRLTGLWYNTHDLRWCRDDLLNGRGAFFLVCSGSPCISHQGPFLSRRGESAEADCGGSLGSLAWHWQPSQMGLQRGPPTKDRVCPRSSWAPPIWVLLCLTRVEASVDLKRQGQRFLNGIFKKTRMSGASMTTPGNSRLHREFKARNVKT